MAPLRAIFTEVRRHAGHQHLLQELALQFAAKHGRHDGATGRARDDVDVLVEARFYETEDVAAVVPERGVRGRRDLARGEHEF